MFPARNMLCFLLFLCCDDANSFPEHKRADVNPSICTEEAAFQSAWSAPRLTFITAELGGKVGVRHTH